MVVAAVVIGAIIVKVIVIVIVLRSSDLTMSLYSLPAYNCKNNYRILLLYLLESIKKHMLRNLASVFETYIKFVI